MASHINNNHDSTNILDTLSLDIHGLFILDYENFTLPVDTIILSKIINSISNNEITNDKLMSYILQDPVLAIESFKIANSSFSHLANKSDLSLREVLLGVGIKNIARALRDMRISVPQDEEAAAYYEQQRNISRKTSKVAKMIAETSFGALTEEVQMTGLFLNIGEMISVLVLGKSYVFAKQKYPEKILRKIFKERYNFYPDVIGLKYLTAQKVPDETLAVVNELRPPVSQKNFLVKNIVWAAHDFILSFESGKWYNWEPDKIIPTNSYVHQLNLSKIIYKKTYERITEYLFQAALQEKNLPE